MNLFECFATEHTGADAQYFICPPVPETGIVGAVAIVAVALYQNPVLLK